MVSYVGGGGPEGLIWVDLVWVDLAWVDLIGVDLIGVDLVDLLHLACYHPLTPHACVFPRVLKSTRKTLRVGQCMRCRITAAVYLQSILTVCVFNMPVRACAPQDPSIARDLADPTEAPDMRQQQLQLQQPQPQQAPSASAAPPPRQRRARPTVVALADASSHVLDEQHTQRDVILAGGQLGPGSSAGTLLVCVEGALPPGAPPAMVLVPSGTTGDLACGGTGAGCGQIMWSHSNICDTITSQAFLSAATATATPKGSLELPEPGSSRWQPRTGVGITSGEGGVAAAAAAAAAASGTMGGSAPNVAMACDRTVGSILSEAGGGASSRAAGGVARLMTSVLGSGPGQGLAAVPALLAPAPVQLAMYLVFPEVLSWASIDAVHIELQSLMPVGSGVRALRAWLGMRKGNVMGCVYRRNGNDRICMCM